MTMRTRFAPSPTGYLHIGGVRTALFNWLLTRRHNGQFVLRIDDTDTERNRDEALQPILDGFRWLGIDWDEGPEIGGDHGPYYQSQRSQSYTDAAMKLLDTGFAYPSYETKEELDEARKKAIADKINFVFRGKHRDTLPAECRKLYDANPTILRFKIPDDQTIVMDDLIRGRVEWQCNLIGDPVILRADGRPLYNFATVVDDVNMGITHVIRAAEHLDNTKIQSLIYQAMDYAVPKFAHVPVVNEPNSKKKLSKRKMAKFLTKEVRATLHKIGWTDEEIDSRDDLNPATVAYYKELGYLPAAVVNYLGRLGWSLDDKSEIIPLPEMIANFSLDRVNDSPAGFDPDKLLWVAGEYMKQLPLAEKVAGVLPFLKRVRLLEDPISDRAMTMLEQLVEACGDRLKVFSDIHNFAPLFLTADPEYDAKAVDKKLTKDPVPDLLSEFREVLAKTNPFDVPTLETALVDYCEAKGVKKNLLIHGLRVATTGQEVGVGLFEGLVILGKDETLRRIDLGLEKAKS